MKKRGVAATLAQLARSQSGVPCASWLFPFIYIICAMDFANTPPAKWSTDQVESWLCAVGLSQVAPAFREAEGAS